MSNFCFASAYAMPTPNGTSALAVIVPPVAGEDRERNRRAELELGGSEMDAIRRDQGRADDVVDLVEDVAVVRILEREQVVAPVERAETERELVVAEDLRRVDREVAARIDR